MTNNATPSHAPRILISGAGIAGLSLAFWLHRFGMSAVVIDRVPYFQALGHYISLKGNGVEVIRQMGLERACRSHEFKLSQVKNMASTGKFLRMGSSTEFDDSLGGYIMLRRSDLAATIFESVKDLIELRYGTEIKSIRDSEDAVEVEFSDGTCGSFDFVFGADGIHSHTRRLVFGENFEFPLGGLYFGLTNSCLHGLEPGDVRVYFGRGQLAMIMPTTRSNISAVFYHGTEFPPPKNRDTAHLKEFLLDAYREFAPEVGNVIAATVDDSFVFSDVISQVRMPSITKGRVALLGDAAHCPTFMSGMGASLALQGARLLAVNLKEHAEAPGRALAAYQLAVSPIAARYQESAMQMRMLVLDRRPWVAIARNIALRVTPKWVLDRGMRKFYHAENMNAQRDPFLR